MNALNQRIFSPDLFSNGIQTTKGFTPEGYFDVLTGKIAVYHAQGVFSTALCNKIVEAFEKSPYQTFQNFKPKIIAIGRTLHTFDDETIDTCFKNAEETMQQIESVYETAGSPNLTRSILSQIQGHLAGKTIQFRPAQYNGLNVTHGLFRSWSHDHDENGKSARLHEDRLQLNKHHGCETKSVLPNTVVTGSIYFANGGGGELTIYDFRPSLDDANLEDHTRQYGFPTSLVEGRPKITVRPEQGDLVFFCSDRLHDVNATTQGNRISSVFFSGLKSGNKTCIYW
jgi:hypothetical protein